MRVASELPAKPPALPQCALMAMVHPIDDMCRHVSHERECLVNDLSGAIDGPIQ